MNAAPKNPPPRIPPKSEGAFAELLRFGLIALIIVIPIRFFVAKPFVVSGSSMDPTFLNGEYLIVDELTYRFENPARGDVIIFKYPKDESKYYIKRIIGLPGETVESQGGKITIVNALHPKGFALNEPYLENKSFDSFKITLGDEYFVMGDNRPQSSDSRFWGPVKEALIIGRPVIRLHPITKIAVLPGEFATPE
ncbi:MAG: signal peptidase I [Candidatus Taylorbacteria bacterium]